MQSHLCVENWHIFFLFIILRNTLSLTVIIRWNVLFVKKKKIYGLLRQVMDLWSTACKHYRKCNVPISTMLLSSRLLILRVLMARFPWNMLRPQLHLLLLTVKTPMLGGLRISHCEKKTILDAPRVLTFSQTKFQNESIIRRVIY